MVNEMIGEGKSQPKTPTAILLTCTQTNAKSGTTTPTSTPTHHPPTPIARRTHQEKHHPAPLNHHTHQGKHTPIHTRGAYVKVMLVTTHAICTIRAYMHPQTHFMHDSCIFWDGCDA